MKIVKIGIIFYCKKIVKTPKFNIRLTLTSFFRLLLHTIPMLKLPLNLALQFRSRSHALYPWLVSGSSRFPRQGSCPP